MREGLAANQRENKGRNKMDGAMMQAIKDASGPLAFNWAVVIGVFVIAGLINANVPPHDKLITSASDPALSYPVGKEEVTDAELGVLGIAVPAFVIFLVAVSQDKMDFCISVLALCQSASATTLTTVLFKKMAGRPRPCFFAMCQWEANGTQEQNAPGVVGGCTGPLKRVWEAKQSFPSGHASLSFAGLGFLTLYLVDRLNSYSRRTTISESMYQLGMFASLVPIALAMWVAVTRTVDYWHNYDDVAAGALIGFGFANLAFQQKGRYYTLVAEDRRTAGRDSFSEDQPMTDDDAAA